MVRLGFALALAIISLFVESLCVVGSLQPKSLVASSLSVRHQCLSAAASAAMLLTLAAPCRAVATEEASLESALSELDTLKTAVAASSTTTGGGGSVAFAEQLQKTRPLASDEFTISFQSESLGISLTEQQYQGFPVCIVKSINDDALKSAHPELRQGAIVVAVGEENTNGVPLSRIADIVKSSSTRPLQVKFRDPSRYFELLDSAAGPPLKLVTTSYLPANARDAGAVEQMIYVQRLEMPPPELRTRTAQLLDVMEIQYVASLASSGSSGSNIVVDSSAERAPPGTSAQSIYYILGQQNGPPGKFPQGWDLTLRGMVVGEKRRITLPYTLAYDRKGSKDRKIPPFATVIYTVKLLSLT